MRLLDAITKNYHENDNDLSDTEFLIDTAVAVTGFPRNEIQEVIDSDEWDRTVDMLSYEVQNRLSVRSRMAGPIVAVPTMVLNNRWVYGGFQKVDEIVEQFELLRQGISPREEYTQSTLVLDAGTADRIAREAKMGSASSSTDDSGNDFNANPM
jgi:predicted DsbA family dithiol-disulfide isomerase